MTLNRLPGSPALIAEIAEVERRVTTIGELPEMRRRWGLSGEPLKAVFGTDTECHVENPHSRRPISEASPSRRFELINQVIEDAHYHLSARPEMDGKYLELKLKAGSPLHIIKTFKRVETEVAGVAQRLNWSFTMGPGHWHLSLRDPGNRGRRLNLLNDAQTPETFSDLAFNLAKNLVMLQGLVPALFLRPSRAERLADPQALEVPHVAATSSFRQTTVRMLESETYKNGSQKFELRMANLSPHVPVLMILHALERTLEGDWVTATHYKRGATNPFLTDANFMRGKGTYAKYLSATSESGYLQRHFPHLERELMNAARASYFDFLRDERRSPAYDGAERQLALRDVQSSLAANGLSDTELWGPPAATEEPPRSRRARLVYNPKDFH